jgi:(heptosyl)LPS beta-1,4-glucosyltransferase
VPKVSAVVITRNEEQRLSEALESVRWADEILVVDAHSTDATVAIARTYTSRVVVRDWPGYVEQKNHAASIAAHDWILSIDADERVTPELALEIRGMLASEPRARGYRIPRRSLYLDTWIRSTDWYPDYQLRLYDRRRGHWNGRYVHESVNVNGLVAVTTGHLEHRPYRSISDHLARIDSYTSLAAKQLAESGHRATPLGLFGAPLAAFVRNYVLKAGFSQGSVGLTVSMLNSYYVFLKYAKLFELQRAAKHRG